jgi:hypothetical protein
LSKHERVVDVRAVRNGSTEITAFQYIEIVKIGRIDVVERLRQPRKGPRARSGEGIGRQRLYRLVMRSVRPGTIKGHRKQRRFLCIHPVRPFLLDALMMP